MLLASVVPSAQLSWVTSWELNAVQLIRILFKVSGGDGKGRQQLGCKLFNAPKHTCSWSCLLPGKQCSQDSPFPHKLHTCDAQHSLWSSELQVSFVVGFFVVLPASLLNWVVLLQYSLSFLPSASALPFLYFCICFGLLSTLIQNLVS